MTQAGLAVTSFVNSLPTFSTPIRLAFDSWAQKYGVVAKESTIPLLQLGPVPSSTFGFIKYSLKALSKARWSHFTALLHKSICYALSGHDIRLNLRSLMWGVGVKGYPFSWWTGTLRRFHRRFDVQRGVTIKQLLIWKVQGRKEFTGLGMA